MDAKPIKLILCEISQIRSRA